MWRNVALCKSARRPFNELAGSRRLQQQANSSAAGAVSVNNKLQVGDLIHGYKLERMDHIKELNIRPYLLRHVTTGSEHLHIERKGDSNNVFAVSLRTTPKNSTGVAHILEHLALCGSKRYAVRDPFFKMLNRSLATFMNAMTGPDYTVYPFSTQNKQDYENLLRVYLDAVFYPRLRPVDFRQEGWRLECERPDKEDTPIVIKGVVYNEMKGLFSSSSSLYSRHLLNHLFPDNTYQHESGGDPEHIPRLTHAELKKFHQLHYHPSNAKFFTYGDIPLEAHLSLINELIMTKFNENSYAKEQSQIQEQEPWKVSKSVNIKCPSDPLCADPNKQTTTSISYMLCDSTDIQEMFLLSVLNSLLMDGPNTPLYQALILSGLGSSFSPSTGLAPYTKQAYMSVGLQGMKQNDIGKVHEIIEKTFQQVVKDGFAPERVEAILHSIELSTKHIRGNQGLSIGMSLNSFWNHDGDVIETMKINEQIENLRRHIQSDKAYLTKAVEKYFISNPHKLILTMEPDDKYQEERIKREKAILDEKISRLKDIDKKTIFYEGMELMKIQNTKEDSSVLPCLSVSKDIPRELEYKTKLSFETHNGVNIQLCEQPTNEIVYFRTSSNISTNDDSRLSDELLDYLPLFCAVATKLGAGALDREQLSQKEQLYTGGLNVGLMLNPSLQKFDNFTEDIVFASRCLKRNVPKMFELWSDIFKGAHFDDKSYLHQLITATACDQAQSVPQSGHMYAMIRSSSGLTKVNRLQERLNGLSYVAKLNEIATKEPIESVVDKLKAISDVVLDPFNLKCSINAEPEVIRHATDELKQFAENIQECSSSSPRKSSASDSQPPSHSHEGQAISPAQKTSMSWMVLPFATNFLGKSFISVPFLHKDYASMRILAKLVSSKFLLKEVREKGGAYGAGASLSTTGVFQYYSYRDPQNLKTLDTFDRSVDWLLKGDEYTEQDIEESKLGVFQDVDKPIEPASKGLDYFLTGKTDEMTREFRIRLLDVNKSDIAEVASRYLKNDKYGAFILGPEPASNSLSKEHEELVKKIEKVDPVLN